jgi:FkbM family methyltransferase
MFNGLCPRSGTRRAKLFGYTVELSLDDHIQRNVYLGTYEPQESALVRRYLRKGMTFVDVGANIGYYSLMAVPFADRVIAFEPSPLNYSHLKRIVMENGIRNMIIEQAGVADQPGEGALYVPKQAGNNTATMVSNPGGSPVAIPVITLDEYFDRHQIAQVDFMKIDVDGFEPRVIAGAQSAIRAKRIAAILCEFCGPWLRANGTTPQEFYELMRSLGMNAAEEPTAKTLEGGNILFTAC